jgi:5S rRNA maturation endonuclease (ribonuclease M5)
MITATGIVVPADWDENGKVIAVAISTHEEEEYLIDDRDKKGKELREMMRQEVEITGVIGKQALPPRTVLTVKNYTIKKKDPPG